MIDHDIHEYWLIWDLDSNIYSGEAEVNIVFQNSSKLVFPTWNVYNWIVFYNKLILKFILLSKYILQNRFPIITIKQDASELEKSFISKWLSWRGLRCPVWWITSNTYPLSDRTEWQRAVPLKRITQIHLGHVFKKTSYLLELADYYQSSPCCLILSYYDWMITFHELF